MWCVVSHAFNRTCRPAADLPVSGRHRCGRTLPSKGELRRGSVFFFCFVLFIHANFRQSLTAGRACRSTRGSTRSISTTGRGWSRRCFAERSGDGIVPILPSDMAYMLQVFTRLLGISREEMMAIRATAKPAELLRLKTCLSKFASTCESLNGVFTISRTEVS